MLEAINTWGDYRTKVREFDAVLEYGKAVSSALVGLVPPSRHASYGEQIFIKLLSHCIVLRRLAADPSQRTPQELWDVPSMSAVARCVVEAHDAFEYIAGHEVAEAERAFRIKLWELHDKTRRLKMFGDIGSTDPRINDIRIEASRLEADLQGLKFFTSLPTEHQAVLRQRLAKGDPPAFHLSQRQRCAQSDVNADWYNAVTMQLSQHVHTLPFSVHQLFQFRAGTPEALRLMGLPLQMALPFLARVTLAMAALMPANVPQPPSRTARTMALWRTLAKHGTKDIA